MIEIRAARAGECEQPLHDVRRAGGNIRDARLEAARGGPRNRRRRRGPESLARDEHDDALMHAGRNAARRGRIRNRRSFGGADLADAIEIQIVVLARQILADDAVAESHVLAAENAWWRRDRDLVPAAPDSDDRKHARRSFLVEIAERIENEQALREIRGDVGFQAVDLRRAAEHRKLRDESRPRAHPSREEIDVGEIGRHPNRHVGGIEQRDPGAKRIKRQRRKSFDGHDDPVGSVERGISWAGGPSSLCEGGVFDSGISFVAAAFRRAHLLSPYAVALRCRLALLPYVFGVGLRLWCHPTCPDAGRERSEGSLFVHIHHGCALVHARAPFA